MKTLHLFPPNFSDINKAFNVRGKPIIYAYGDTIYNPARIVIPPQLIAHEQVHLRRQGGEPETWWERYLRDRAFRLAEEVPAHAAEYGYFRDRVPAGARLADILQGIAHRLASPLYGSLVDVDEAKRLIQDGQGASR